MLSAHVASGAKCYQVSQFVGILVALYSKLTKWNDVVNGWISTQLHFCCAAVLACVVVTLPRLATLCQPVGTAVAISATFPERMNFATNVCRVPVRPAARTAEIMIYPIGVIWFALHKLAALIALDINAIVAWVVFANTEFVPTRVGTKLSGDMTTVGEFLATLLACGVNCGYCLAGRVCAFLGAKLEIAPLGVSERVATVGASGVYFIANHNTFWVAISAFYGTIAEFLLTWGNKFFAAQLAIPIRRLNNRSMLTGAFLGAKFRFTMRGIECRFTKLASVLHKRKPPVAQSIGRVFRTLQWQQEAGITIA